jgi:hypothetical protein
MWKCETWLHLGIRPDEIRTKRQGYFRELIAALSVPKTPRYNISPVDRFLSFNRYGAHIIGLVGVRLFVSPLWG